MQARFLAAHVDPSVEPPTLAAMAHPLDGCNAKLNRAREHLDTLHAAYTAYLATDPFVTDQVYDVAASEIRFVGRVLQSPPITLGVIVGDLIHNLRSALDHLVWQLVLDNGKEPTRDNQFPVCTQKDKWGTASGRMLARVRGAHVHIIEAYQPFQSINPDTAPLASLHRLWNDDKHQVVMTVLAATRDPSEISFVRRPISLDKFKPVRDIKKMLEAEGYYGTPLNNITLARLKVKASGPEPRAEMLSQWQAGLTFANGAPVETSVNAMATQVEAIINTFGPSLTPH